jgi:hypothetical protein
MSPGGLPLGKFPGLLPEGRAEGATMVVLFTIEVLLFMLLFSMTGPRSDALIVGGDELFCMAKRSVPAVGTGTVDGPGRL